MLVPRNMGQVSSASWTPPDDYWPETEDEETGAPPTPGGRKMTTNVGKCCKDLWRWELRPRGERMTSDPCAYGYETTESAAKSRARLVKHAMTAKLETRR